MAFTYKPHFFAVLLMKKLAASEGLRFNQLLTPELESEHMNYYLKQLVDRAYVVKSDDEYVLTDKGKDFVDRMDKEKYDLEKQSSVMVLLNVRRKNADGKIEHLVNRRLTQPYMNKVGRIGGKVKFGEMIQQAALRKFTSETGLSADLDDCKIVQVFHKLRWNKEGDPVQDAVFFVCSIDKFNGELIEKTPVQENFWITKEDVVNREDIDAFDTLILNDSDDPKDYWFVESGQEAQGY